MSTPALAEFGSWLRYRAVKDMQKSLDEAVTCTFKSVKKSYNVPKKTYYFMQSTRSTPFEGQNL